jgi:hypothetical protein
VNTGKAHVAEQAVVKVSAASVRCTPALKGGEIDFMVSLSVGEVVKSSRFVLGKACYTTHKALTHEGQIKSHEAADSHRLE